MDIFGNLRHGCYMCHVMHCIKEQAMKCVWHWRTYLSDKVTYTMKRMFFIRCVSDMYSDHAEGIEVDTIPRKLEEKS